MKELAGKLKHENSLLVFGRGYNYATALEAALKVLLLTVVLCPWVGCAGITSLFAACLAKQYLGFLVWVLDRSFCLYSSTFVKVLCYSCTGQELSDLVVTGRPCCSLVCWLVEEAVAVIASQLWGFASAVNNMQAFLAACNLCKAARQPYNVIYSTTTTA